jgi:hypothetical protein
MVLPGGVLPRLFTGGGAGGVFLFLYYSHSGYEL